MVTSIRRAGTLFFFIWLASVLSGCVHTDHLPENPEKVISQNGEFALPLHPHLFRPPLDYKLIEGDHQSILTIWDRQNRLYQVGFYHLDKHRFADVPEYASNRTILQLVLRNYLREALSCTEAVLATRTIEKSFIPFQEGEAFTMVVRGEQPRTRQTKDATIYHGLMIFKKGAYAYIVQHRQSVYNAEALSTLLTSIAEVLEYPNYADQVIPPEKDILSSAKPR